MIIFFKGFPPYVNVLAEFMIDKFTSSSLTISIEGDWGCGKSSFLKQLDDSFILKEPSSTG